MPDPYGPPDPYGGPDPYSGPDPYGPADSNGPVAAYDPADAYGPADPYGPPEAYGQADPYGPDTYGPADAYSADGQFAPTGQFGPTDRYGLADPVGPGDAYRPAGGHPGDAYRPAGPYPADAGPADEYAPADPYGPADEYGPPDRFGPPDRYDPTGHYQPTGRYEPAGAPNPADGYIPADTSNPGDTYGPADAYGPASGFPPNAPPALAGSGTTHETNHQTSRADPTGQAVGFGQVDPRETDSLRGPANPAWPPGQTSLPGQTSAPGAPSATGAPSPPVVTPGQPAVPPHPAEPTESLTPEYLLPGRRRAPAPGWRRIVYQATGGLMRVPSSAAELRRREMIGRVRTPVAGGHHRVAVLSLKGGVGKTTTTVGLGSTLASLRGDRVIAVDANPDRGTLSDKIGLETAATVRDLLNERRRIRRYADVRAFTSQAPSRLEVLASDRDPTISVAFSDADYCGVSAVLEHYYSICLTDCGTGLLHSAMGGVLRLADQIVLVSSPSVDGARSASATLDWLAAHSYGDLVRNAVVVLSVVRPRSRSTVDLARLEEHFAARCRAVTRIPYDPHLEEGAEVELDQLNRATADAYLALAAIIGDGLAWPRSAAAAQA